MCPTSSTDPDIESLSGKHHSECAEGFSFPVADAPELAVPVPAALFRALERTLAGRRRLVLAVSGGLDSMTLLHAVARWSGPGVELTVATFDHGTGEAARRAAALVISEACRLGIPAVTGRARLVSGNEASWRAARWNFLERVASRRRAVVVTAHTRDDQVETVVQRLLRGASARGLAALRAPSPVRRPWLDIQRAALTAWAEASGIPYVLDPSNISRLHQRNRIRHDLLPALRRLHPLIDDELAEVGRRAAVWRRDMELFVDGLRARRDDTGATVVARASLAGYSHQELAVLWPALAGRAGIRLDRRGTSRLAAFTMSPAAVGRVPLSGGSEVMALTNCFVIRRRRPALLRDGVLDGDLIAGDFIFRTVAGEGVGNAPLDDSDQWWAALPTSSEAIVRSWRPGDRIRNPRTGAPRRVKRYLAEAGIPGPLREGWPVVLVAEEIVWIPGVCRGLAATARPGRPELLYVCERIRR